MYSVDPYSAESADHTTRDGTAESASRDQILSARTGTGIY